MKECRPPISSIGSAPGRIARGWLVRVGEHDLRAEVANRLPGHALDRGPRADGHEDRGLDVAMRRMQDARARMRLGVLGDDIVGEQGLVHEAAPQHLGVRRATDAHPRHRERSAVYSTIGCHPMRIAQFKRHKSRQVRRRAERCPPRSPRMPHLDRQPATPPRPSACRFRLGIIMGGARPLDRGVGLPRADGNRLNTPSAPRNHGFEGSVYMLFLVTPSNLDRFAR